MSAATPSYSPPAHATPAQPATPTTVTNKIFVSGLGHGGHQEDVMELFSSYGEVEEVVVDGSSATVAFQEERVVQELEQVGEIMLGSRKLHIARVLEEQLDAPEDEVPFYQAGAMPVPTPYQQQQQYQNTGVSSSYPAYLPVYPYPVYQQQPPPSPYYDPAISDCGPVQPQTYQATNPYSLPPPSNASMSSVDKSVFRFDTMATQIQKKYPHNPNSLTPGCCHVCSTPAVHGVAPLTGHHHPPYYGHQLQPLTPMTPSLNTGYLLPPTPTPMNLPPMTPTYYLPPSPAPQYMMYQRPADVGGLPCTSIPPPQSYTSLKPSDNGTNQEDLNTHRQNVAYFTSPFKRFSKFRGTPTPARFPLRTAPVPQVYRGRGGQGDSSSWYQQGDRWGQKSGGEGEQENEGEVHAPDLVRDCKGSRGVVQASVE